MRQKKSVFKVSLLIGGILLVGMGLSAQRQFFPYCPLADAADAGNWAQVIKLVNQGADVNQADDRDQTALMYAAIWNRPEIVKLLLAKGADVTRRDQSGCTALGWALSPNKPLNPEVVSLLKKAGD